MVTLQNMAAVNNEDAFECDGCGEGFEGDGNTVTLHPGNFEEPPEYGSICDDCAEHDCEPPDDYYYDDPALDYVCDPYCD